MSIIKNKFIFLTIAALLVVASIVIVAVKGLNIGIEFTGGSVVEVSYDERPDTETINQALASYDFRPSVQAFGEEGYIIRTRELSEADRGVLLAALNIDEQAPQVERLNTVGPSIGKEVRSKAFLAIALVVVAIILYIAFVFRKVSPGIEEDAEKIPSSWKYGFIAILALLHDIAIPIGVFALFQIEISSLFVVGLLSILGLSVNDTIVVFDRIRENLTTNKEEKTKESFAATVGRALRQTMARSINTSLTLLIVLGALLAVGPVAIQELALVLLIGTFVGTYSSIFIASPLLVLWNKNT